MSYISPTVSAAALARIANAKTLSVCSRQVSSMEELATAEIGRAPVRFMKGDTTLTVLPIKNGDVLNPGEAKYFALVDESGVLLSAPLKNPQRLALGHAFDLESFSINFP